MWIDRTSVTCLGLGSQELCRAAVMLPVREVMPYPDNGSLASLDVDALDMSSCRKVAMRDFDTALDRVRPTGKAGSAGEPSDAVSSSSTMWVWQGSRHMSTSRRRLRPRHNSTAGMSSTLPLSMPPWPS
jgi:hypothetical protein